ncbi:MAG: crossover junction endodeoxyribonuclease RuvC [Mangrovibacterium sp.]
MAFRLKELPLHERQEGMEKVEKLILGIDPGTVVMGYGLISVKGNDVQVLQAGVIKTGAYKDHYLRLNHLFSRMQAILEDTKPDELAIESAFYGKDVQAMLKLGRAQGIIMGLALQRDIPIFEYAPLKVKQAITGMGRAAKEQVAYFLKNTMKIPNLPPELDATDAIAVAVCHYLQQKNPLSSKQYKGWGDFIKKNPGRVK